MKKYNLLISFVVTAIFLVIAFPVSVYAETLEKCAVYDYSDVLSEEEEDSLNELIKSSSEELNMNIAVVFTDEGPYVPDYYTDEEVAVLTKEYAEDVYEEIFVGDDNSSGIIFVADYSHSFFSFSLASKSIDEYQPHIERFIEDTGPYLRSHDSYGAAVKFIENADLRSYKKSHALKSFRTGGLISLVVTAVTCLGISFFYKRHNEYSSRHYLINRESRFTVNSDQFIRQYVTKSKIESSGSSSGGSSGGSHSCSGGGGSRI